MAPPLIALRQARLSFDNRPLFDDLTLALYRRDRVCLVGRNGSGKSTLLRVLAGTQDLDAGERFLQPGTAVAFLPQAPEIDDPAYDAALSVDDYLRLDVYDQDRDRSAEAAALIDALDLKAGSKLGTLSGGEARRAAIARGLLARSEVLLLDEPTNHLDIATIEWLERRLAGYRGALLLISHDRAFLERTVEQTLWLDRGTLRRLEKPFSQFEAWAADLQAAEEQARHKLDRRIAREEHWLTHGVTARRKRNQGRLRQLRELRRERAAWLSAPASVKMTLAGGAKGGDLVIEATGLSKSFALPNGTSRVIVEDFSTRIRRRDRIGVIGSNGAGKTTLVRLLIGEIVPDGGTVRHGHGLASVYFDQKREALDPQATLWETLVPGGGDSLMVQGRQRHVVSYLRDFLFSEVQARQPVRSLSGGERSRLLLARLFARPANLIVLDEPTNDLDMETLDLLEAVLGDYDGTLLMVSHDRDFLDRLATGIILMEGDGRAQEFAGGYRDAVEQFGKASKGGGRDKNAPRRKKGAERPRAPGRKLSYKDQRELESLPEKIEALETDIESLRLKLADPELYRNNPDEFTAFSQALAAHETALREAEERWLELETLKEALTTTPAR
jgi:ATP-binding cassette subfamily F protein uup